jgi:modification methylase
MIPAMSAREPLLENTVLVGDCVEAMERLPAGSIDMIFADPPYNLQLKEGLRRPNSSLVDGVSESWDRFDGFAAYDRFTRDWLSAARRVLKADGTLWVIGTYHNIYRIGALLQDLGFWMLNDVVWRKTNPMPNFRGRRFTNAHETLLWCARDKESRYSFNYEAMKSLNEGLQMRSDWLLPLCNGSERLKRDGKKAHPTQKPEALLYRVILAATKPGELVLDPFFGTGTTGAVAKRLGRRYLGIERDPDYAAIARERLAAIAGAAEAEVLHLPSKREAPRIPFGHLVERRLLAPGTLLFGPRRRWTAKVRADGSIVSAEHKGSIHQVGAAVQGAPACNGWTFWQVRVNGSGNLVPIDVYRQKLRAEMEKAAQG